MKKKNGFTLVELIVVIAIIGLVLIIAFPSLQNALRKSSSSQFKTYENLFIEATKLYIDKEHPQTLKKDGNCYMVNLGVLRTSELIKEGEGYEDINNCSGNILVTKKKNGYLYQPSISCTFNKNTSKENSIHSSNYPLENKISCSKS
ncbi:MAG: type II secretion system protein [Bacilli bacterium]